jgi:O-antigen ligase
MTSSLSRRRPPALDLRISTIAIILGALSLCAVVDMAVLEWIRKGPPQGKSSDQFFLELVLLLAAAIVFGAVALLAPSKAQTAVPYLFIALAWHTGFLIDPPGGGGVHADVFDLLIPLTVFIALLGRWYSRPSVAVLAPYLRRPLAVFAVFWLWGVCLALGRGVALGPMVANLKALALYPLIALIIPWCITSRRQLYGAVALLLALIFERALVGVQQHAIGDTFARVNGDFGGINQYAMYVMTGVLIAVALVACGRSQWYRLPLALVLSVPALALLLTQSRGAWLGTSVGLVALGVLLGMRRLAILLGLIVVVAAVVMRAQPNAGTIVIQRVSSQHAQGTIVYRQDKLSLGLQVVEHYPFGAGWGADFHSTPGGLAPDDSFPWYHDDYLQLATEIGILGLAAFAWIWVAILRLGVRAFRMTRESIHGAVVLGLLVATVGALVQAGTDQFFWEAGNAEPIWIVAGLLLASVALGHQSAILGPYTAAAANRPASRNRA